MSRTRGARDISKRKTRSDRTRPYSKKYDKVIYKSNRKPGDPLKLWFWDITPMSIEGWKRIPAHSKLHMRKNVYGRNKLRIDVEPQLMNTQEKLEFIALENLWEGSWILFMFSFTGSNKYHCKPVEVARFRITSHPEGLRCRMVSNKRLFRYKWFYKG